MLLELFSYWNVEAYYFYLFFNLYSYWVHVVYLEILRLGYQEVAGLAYTSLSCFK